MKSINLTNSSDLKKLQKEMISVLDNRIKEAELSEAVKNIDTLSFGDLRCIFESIADKLYDTKKGKSIIRKYASTIKENKSLKNYYLISECIRQPQNVTDSFIFLSESLSLSNSIAKKEFNEGMKKMSDIVKSAVIEAKMSKEDLLNTIESNKILNESINYVLTNKKSIKNLAEYASHVSTLNEHIKNNNVNTDTLTESKDAKFLFQDLQESLNNSSLEIWENQAIADIALCQLSNSNKEDLFEQYKSKCLSTLTAILESEKNVEDISRLSTMKEQLSLKEYSEENLKEDILKLAKLNYTLSE